MWLTPRPPKNKQTNKPNKNKSLWCEDRSWCRPLLLSLSVRGWWPCLEVCPCFSTPSSALWDRWRVSRHRYHSWTDAQGMSWYGTLFTTTKKTKHIFCIYIKFHRHTNCQLAFLKLSLSSLLVEYIGQHRLHHAWPLRKEYFAITSVIKYVGLQAYFTGATLEL